MLDTCRTSQSVKVAASELVQLTDGRNVLVRSVQPNDLNALRLAISEADAETLRSRFLGGRPPTKTEELHHLVEVDHRRREAFVAFDGQERLVGIARYEAIGDTAAEVAVAVDPLWRHAGLATVLLRRLLAVATDCGFRTVHVEYFATNRDVSDLVQRLGVRMQHNTSHGVAEDELTLRDPMPAQDSDAH